MAKAALKKAIAREFSAGGVVFKKEGDKILWLATKAAKSSGAYSFSAWRLPKGWLDDEKEGVPGPLASGKIKAQEEDLRKAALKEVREEGGIEARVVEKIGTEKFFFTWEGRKILKFVTFYLMAWVKDLPEGFGPETSEIYWGEFDQAEEKLSFPGEKKILSSASSILGRHI